MLAAAISGVSEPKITLFGETIFNLRIEASAY
jgi:hypothetical protein